MQVLIPPFDFDRPAPPYFRPLEDSDNTKSPFFGFCPFTSIENPTQCHATACCREQRSHRVCHLMSAPVGRQPLVVHMGWQTLRAAPTEGHEN